MVRYIREILKQEYITRAIQDDSSKMPDISMIKVFQGNYGKKNRQGLYIEIDQSISKT